MAGFSRELAVQMKAHGVPQNTADAICIVAAEITILQNNMKEVSRQLDLMTNILGNMASGTEAMGKKLVTLNNKIGIDDDTSN